ncbi:MAG TPA: WD40 repeat domain-containing protein [Vicinamibacterales bacterium]|jgi:WD40 repeat protein|nr:WD40 repeat domain-containing protein [Vicinamibacterales bacterium]
MKIFAALVSTLALASVASTIAAPQRPDRVRRWTRVRIVGGSAVAATPGAVDASTIARQDKTLEITAEEIRAVDLHVGLVVVPVRDVVSLGFSYDAFSALAASGGLFPFPARSTQQMALIEITFARADGEPSDMTLEIDYRDRADILRALVQATGKSISVTARNLRDIPRDVPVTAVDLPLVSVIAGVPRWQTRSLDSRHTAWDLALSPDGSRLVGADHQAGILQVWNTSTWTLERDTLNVGGRLLSMVFRRDGTLATCETYSVLAPRNRPGLTIWNLDTGAASRHLSFEGGLDSCRIAESGRFAVLDFSGHKTDPTLVVDVDTGAIRSLSGRDRFRRALNPFTGDVRSSAAVPGGRVEVLNDGTWLATDDGLAVIDPRDGRTLASSEGAAVAARRVLAFNRDLDVVATPADERRIALWALPSLDVHVLNGARSAIAAVAIDASSHRVAATTLMGQLIVWDADRGTMLGYCVIDAPGAQSNVIFVNDGRAAVATSWLGRSHVTACSAP